jgi:predicted Zn-dependent protease with MMP-like domain
MERERFEQLVVRAVETLPEEFKSRLENVDVVVEDRASQRQLNSAKLKNPNQLLGLYQGVPQTRRGVRYGMVVPDRIYIFQKPIEAICRSEREIELRITEVVRHEIAHHFGTDERTLRQIEAERRKRQRGQSI